MQQWDAGLAPRARTSDLFVLPQLPVGQALRLRDLSHSLTRKSLLCGEHQQSGADAAYAPYYSALCPICKWAGANRILPARRCGFAGREAESEPQSRSSP